MLHTQSKIRITWVTETLLCGIVLLNANALSANLGMPTQLFSPFLLFLCCCIIVVLRKNLMHCFRSPGGSTYLFCFGFLGIGAISAANSHYVDLNSVLGEWGGSRYAASLLLILCGCLIGINAHQTDSVNRLLKLLLIASAAASMSGLLLPFLGVSGAVENTETDARSWAQGVFQNVNELGLQSGYPISFGLALVLQTLRLRWLMIGLVSGCFGALASSSKSASLMILALLLYIGIQGAFSWKRSPRVSSILLTIGTSTLILIMILVLKQTVIGNVLEMNTEQLRRIEQLTAFLAHGDFGDDITTGRTSIWDVALKLGMQSPVFGAGLTSFDIIPGANMNVHNTFLVVFGEAGIVASLMLIFTIVTWILAIKQCKSSTIQALSTSFMLIQFCLWMSSGSGMFLRPHNLVTGCIMGLLISCGHRSEPQTKKRTPSYADQR